MTDGYTLQELRRAVEQCNWRKGYGTPTYLRRYGDGKIEVTIARPFMLDVKRRGRVAAGRVYFAGTSAKVRVLQHPDYN